MENIIIPCSYYNVPESIGLLMKLAFKSFVVYNIRKILIHIENNFQMTLYYVSSKLLDQFLLSSAPSL